MATHAFFEERYGVKPEVEGFACDVASEDSVQVVMQEIADRWGKIDVLVASAGMCDLIETIISTCENFTHPAYHLLTHRLGLGRYC